MTFSQGPAIPFQFPKQITFYLSWNENCQQLRFKEQIKMHLLQDLQYASGKVQKQKFANIHLLLEIGIRLLFRTWLSVCSTDMQIEDILQKNYPILNNQLIIN